MEMLRDLTLATVAFLDTTKETFCINLKSKNCPIGNKRWRQFVVNAECFLLSLLVTFPGETGEKAETEMENEKVSQRAETKEEETGEAVDLSAATELGMATEG